MFKKIVIMFALAAASVAQQPAKTKVAASAPAAGGTIVLKGGKLLTITHGVIENGVVVMENGRITAVGAASTSIHLACRSIRAGDAHSARHRHASQLYRQPAPQ